MTTIAVIGAGFSGTLLTLHLLGCCPPATRVLLIERNTPFGRGLAYATDNPSHLLNVPTGGMSAFHDRPDHFQRWLAALPEPARDGASAEAQGFAPRRLYGAYLQALLNEDSARRGPERLALITGDVLSLDRDGDALRLTLDRDRTVQADIAVLAIGNFPPAPIPVADRGFYDTPLYKPDPWAPDLLAGLAPEAGVLLLGTGLTTVDAVISLLDHGHRGPIHALSRRGLLPRPHQAVAPNQPVQQPYPARVNALTRMLRQQVARAAACGSGWPAVIDALRPFTVDLWHAMPAADRRRFLRHLRPWWDVHRHRMAGPVADRIDAARQSGHFQVRAGRVQQFAVTGGDVHVLYRPRGQLATESLQVARVINCAGPSADYDRIPDPLIRCLLDAGAVRPDPLRLGLDVTLHGALRTRDGEISRRLFAIGPVTKGMFWEITAVPDIRRQAETLAKHLASVVKTAR